MAHLLKAALLCALAGLWPALGLAGEANDAARTIAGLREVSSHWNAYEVRIGKPLQKWARQEIGAPPAGAVFYPFSGPDLPTVVHLFPDAERYVLVSNEKAQAPPRLDGNSGKEEYLAAMRKAWRFYGALGFFRTEDLEAMGIGMTGPLMAFSSLLGFEIESIEPIQIDARGRDVAPATSWDSVRLTLRKGGRLVFVDYIRMDLRDGWLRQVAQSRQWIDDMAWNPVVLKAASHLPQDPEFTILRDSILANAPVIVQDETGIDYGALAEGFGVRLYGKFTRANGSFGGNLQSSLAAAYRKSPVKSLPFRFGYEKDAGSALQIAARRPNPASTTALSGAETRSQGATCRQC